MNREPRPYMQNRELSWLKFNERVLEEAQDPTNPLAERLKFVSIFTSNLDEFFMIRVGSLYDMVSMGDLEADSRTGLTAKQQLDLIYRRIPAMVAQRDSIYADIQSQLQSYGIIELYPAQLTGKDKEFLKAYFKTQLLPILSPQIVDSSHPFPHLQNNAVYVIAQLHSKDRSLFGLVPVPTFAPDVVYLPGGGVRFVRTERIIMENLKRVFDQYNITDKNCICATRNGDITPQDEGYDVDDDFRLQMQKLLHKRRKMAVVRLECALQPDGPMMSFLCKRCLLDPAQIFVSQAPMKLAFIFPMLKKLSDDQQAQLLYPPFSPQTLPRPAREKCLHLVRKRDFLFHYPFESMEFFLRLIREAATDSSVLSIQITIYRLAQKARLVEYLSAAAENGKEVTVVIELRARFDEQNNIDWSERLEDAGCRVIYGFSDYKIHSKLCLITTKGKSGISYITQIGTGNYNEKTSEQYTDLSLITADQSIGQDAAEFFKNISVGNLDGNYNRLLVSPFNLKQVILLLIGEEIARGSRGRIIMKMNSLTDYDVIEKLAEASRAGVRVDLIVRGICCLVPGVPGHTEHITVTSIVGRFLEHSRIYSFGAGENQTIYLGSADMMTRNTERRVEVICPVRDAACKARLNHILDILLQDTLKARALGRDGIYRPKAPAPGTPELSSQAYFMEEAIRACHEGDIHSRSLAGLWHRLFPLGNHE